MKLILCLVFIAVFTLPVKAGTGNKAVNNYVDNYVRFTCGYLLGGASLSDALSEAQTQAMAKAKKYNYDDLINTVLAKPDLYNYVSDRINTGILKSCGNTVQIRQLRR